MRSRTVSSVLALATVVGIAIASIVAASGPADACTCLVTDAKTSLGSGDAAFIGEAINRREDPQPIGDVYVPPVVWTFAVDEVIKGDVGETVEVRTGYGSADCGVDFTDRGIVGVILWSGGGFESTSICGGVWSAGELHAATAPLPTPLPGNIDLIVAQRFGEARMRVFDREGDLLGYGFGSDAIADMVMCPGNRLLVERLTDNSIEVRDLVTLDVVNRIDVPHRENPPYFRDIIGLACLDTEASTIVGLAPGWIYVGEPAGELWSLTGDGHDSTNVGAARSLAVDARGNAFLLTGQHGDRVDRLDLDTKEVTPFVELGEGLDGRLMSISVDGRFLAILAHSDRAAGHSQEADHLVILHVESAFRIDLALDEFHVTEPPRFLNPELISLSSARPDTTGRITLIDIEGEIVSVRPTARFMGDAYAFVEDNLVLYEQERLGWYDLQGERIRDLEATTGLPIRFMSLPNGPGVDPRAAARIVPGPLPELPATEPTTTVASTTSTTSTEAPTTPPTSVVSSTIPPAAAGENGGGSGPLIALVLLVATLAVSTLAWLGRRRRHAAQRID